MDRADLERREFLRKFGRFAAATPPLITAVLSAPASADSWQSGGHHHRCHDQEHHCRQGGDGNEGHNWSGTWGGSWNDANSW